MNNVDTIRADYKPNVSAMDTDVWTLDLERLKRQVRREPGLRALLAPSERARATQFADPGLSELYVAAHVGLRLILVERCGTKVAGQEFATSPGGKPFLPGGPEFNISRSGSLGLVAVSDRSRVGVDIERMRPVQIDNWPIRYPVLRLFATSADHDEPQAFLRGWVRLEAWCKRRGLALAPVLERRADELFGDGDEVEISEAASELFELDVPPGYLGCCASDALWGIRQRPLDS
jgi:4'-phosphopantetheinyl transferase